MNEKDACQGSDLREKLLGMRERWAMYAVTREAFVVQTHPYLHAEDVRKINLELLGVPGTVKADAESCRTLLDETFAHRAIDLALKLYDAREASRR